MLRLINKIFIVSYLFLIASNLHAGVDLPWTTTHDCDAWDEYSETLDCDGMEKKLNITAEPGGYYEQITTDANYPGGEGGKGHRHWVGDGTNNQSGGIKIAFNTPQTKIWVRWYQRWESGFSSSWDTFKNIWFECDDGNRNVFHTGYLGGLGGVDLNPPDNTVYVADVAYGSTFYTSGTSDGSWQMFEVHIDIPNATCKIWVNEVLVLDRDDVEFFETQTSIVHLLVPVNTKNVINGQAMYIDFDDFAINNTGYIGPLRKGGLKGGSVIGAGGSYQ